MARILIVDDEPEVRDVLGQFLRKKSYEVSTAESGDEALSLLDCERMDAVLLDIRMPGLNGLQTLNCIRQRWPGLPVVMVSGEDDEDVARATLKEGAFDYVMKPFNFDYLERTLHFKLLEELP